MSSHDTALANLTAHLRTIGALEQAGSVLAWDQETMMPPRGAPQRAEQMGALESVLHGLRADPRLGDWLAALDGARLDAAARVNAAEAARMHARATRVPAALAEEIARKTALAQGIWAEARAAGTYATFAPALADVLSLKRREAEHRRTDEASLYDVLMQDFEPGMTSAEMSAILARLRTGLVNLRGRIAGSGRDQPRLSGSFDSEAQMALARALPGCFGYDWKAGRLDRSVHPFSSGNFGDTRITTRVDPDNPFDCIYSTIHETGHAVYEQGIDPAHALTPAGTYASMAVHESQSRMFENQIGRGRAFAGHLHALVTQHLGDTGLSADQFYAAANRVETGFIRTEADEVHYNLHVLMRFDLEQALVGGDLAVSDLPGAWNDRFAADFGVNVPDDARGALQDVHWSIGLFGYFPTYSLGNVYAAALFEAMTKALPGLESDLARGDTSRALAWLRANVHRHGRLLPARQLVAKACGGAVDEGPLLRYLDTKFGALYNL